MAHLRLGSGEIPFKIGSPNCRQLCRRALFGGNQNDRHLDLKILVLDISNIVREWVNQEYTRVTCFCK